MYVFTYWIQYKIVMTPGFRKETRERIHTIMDYILCYYINKRLNPTHPKLSNIFQWPCNLVRKAFL